MLFRSFFTCTVIFSFMSFLCLAQGNKQIIPSSPEASALAKTINYPVSYNTGIPDISVPLYQVQTGGMTLPITLNYHAGGFKIQERATSIGLGWNISSDIQISRSINGGDDLGPGGYMNNGDMKTYYRSSSDYFMSTRYPLETGVNGYKIATNEIDGMPDKFYYKLLNKSGSFYFRKSMEGYSYTIVPVPFDNLNISYNNGQFTIVDTDGTSYVFGGQGSVQVADVASKATELSGGLRTAWKCVSIQNATKTESITFTYQAKSMQRMLTREESIEYYNNENPCSMPVYWRPDQIQQNNALVQTYEALVANYPFYSLSSPKYQVNFASGNSVFHMPYLNSQNQWVDKTYPVQNQMTTSSSEVYGIAPSRIDFRGGAIVFNGADQLNFITVMDGQNNEVKRFSFSQSYAAPANLANATSLSESSFLGTRYLDSLEFSAGLTYEKYKFLYESKFCFGSHLIGKDAWGYPNESTIEWNATAPFLGITGKDIVQRYFWGQYGGCSNYTDNVAFHIGNDINVENPSPRSARAGMLKRIIHPTGGYVDFEFESNMYKQNVGTYLERVGMSGGLRVKSINYYDGKSALPVSQKYYRYGEVEDGIGLLINSPTKSFDPAKRNFDSYSYSQTTSYLSGPDNINMGTNGNTQEFIPVAVDCRTMACLYQRYKEKKTTYLSASSMDYTYPTGAPIYYTKVSEYNQDLGTVTGKRVYTFYEPEYFQPYPYYSTSKIPGTNLNVLQTDGLMGMQKSIEDYLYSNGKYSLAHSKEFQYTKFSHIGEIRVVYAYFNTVFQIVSGNFGGTNATLYDQGPNGGNLNDIFTSGQYGIQVARLLPGNETEKWVDHGQTVEQTTNYEYSNPNYPQPTKVIVSDSKGTHYKTFKYAYDYAGISVYDQMKTNNRISEVIEEVSYNAGIEVARTKTNYGQINSYGSIAPFSVEQSVAGSALETAVTYDLYDMFGNILQLTEKGGRIKSYVWGYGNKYPVAQIIGATYASATLGLDVPALQNLTNPVAVRGTVNPIRGMVPGAMVSVYTYKPLTGVLSESGPNGKVKFYEYDPYGRLSVVRDEESNILKKFDYHITGPTASFAATRYYPNTGVMQSYNKHYGTNSDFNKRLVNAIVPGGTLYNMSNEVNAANGVAENNMAINWASLSPEAGPSEPDATTRLKLNTWPSNPVVPKAYLDLIQDNGVVVSKLIPYNTPSSSFGELYIVPGIYRLGIRFNENYNGSLSWLQVSSPSGTQQVRSGDEISFQSGQEYTFVLFNN